MLRYPHVTLWNQYIKHQRAHDSCRQVLFVDVTTIPYPKIWSHHHYCFIGEQVLLGFHIWYPSMHMAWFHQDGTNMCFVALVKKAWKQVYCKHLNYVFKFLCQMDFRIDSFILSPTYTYNEIVQLLDLARVIEHLLGLVSKVFLYLLINNR